MSLQPGTRLGPYEITGGLGAGGMGEVYRARDSRLNRDVAIKTLSPEFACDRNRMLRFQREAQMLAALTHPNIAAIYGLEELEGGCALVMELVEGQTLAQRLKAGPIPWPEALNIARQIAAGLEAAHEKGIIHRDLKPANIKVTPQGEVKVLDFGVAKAFEGELLRPADGNAANSPTVTLDSTIAGVVMGTAAYMSPEQARGGPVDKRSDIWSFGVVFFEMLTGRGTFRSGTVTDTLAAVLRAELDWTTLPPDTPPRVRHLLKNCLERNPKRRLRDIGDAWLEIDAPEEPVTAPRSRALPWLAAGLVAAAAIAWALLHPVAGPQLVTRWSSVLPSTEADLALSRDGTRLAYVDNSGASSHIVVRRVDQFEAKPLAGTEGGSGPEFAPDGQWIAYSTADNKIKKVPVTGGSPLTLCDGNAAGMSWGEDHTIVFGTTGRGLMRVPDSGGSPQPVTTLKPGETSHRYPQILPGSTVLFTMGTGANYDAARIAAFDPKSGRTRTLLNAGFRARYAPTGHLVYMRGESLLAVPFNARSLKVTGPETAVVEGVYSFLQSGYADYAFSDSGLLVYVQSAGRQRRASTLYSVDLEGKIAQLPVPPHQWGTAVLSPDGRRAAATIWAEDGEGADIWILELDRGTQTRLTFEGLNRYPVWTPDGRRVTFDARRGGRESIDWVAADGSGKPETLLAGETPSFPSSWTPDGKDLLFSRMDAGSPEKIWVLPVPGGEPHPLHAVRSPESHAQISPDGHWVAYYSFESGRSEVYVQPFPGPGGKIQISTDGGMYARWARSGRQLFYVEPDSKRLMSVQIQVAPEFRAGRPQALFTLTSPGATWDVAPDGKHFLVERSPDVASLTGKLQIVTNWFQELRK